MSSSASSASSSTQKLPETTTTLTTKVSLLPKKLEWEEKYNAKNIHNLTYDEIIMLNRERNKTTFFDRSWRDKVDASRDLEDENISRWQKFIQGRYSLNNVGRNFAK